MPRVVFTANIQRHVACPPEDVPGSTVKDVLEQVFRRHPRARGYVLDDQGALRKHVVVFVGGDMIRDRQTLADSVPAGAEVCVMQALSGG